MREEEEVRPSSRTLRERTHVDLGDPDDLYDPKKLVGGLKFRDKGRPMRGGEETGEEQLARVKKEEEDARAANPALKGFKLAVSKDGLRPAAGPVKTEEPEDAPMASTSTLANVEALPAVKAEPESPTDELRQAAIHPPSTEEQPAPLFKKRKATGSGTGSKPGKRKMV